MQGAVSVGGAYNIELEVRITQRAGDYLYRSGSSRWDVESGMWGILRIKQSDICRHRQRDAYTNGKWWKNPWWF